LRVTLLLFDIYRVLGFSFLLRAKRLGINKKIIKGKDIYLSGFLLRAKNWEKFDVPILFV